MNCASCQHENSATARFCESCGTAQPRACAGCGAALSPAARFCAQCGRQTEASAPTPSSPAAIASQTAQPAPPSAGERRLLSAMFCDLVGSTELSQRLDAEDLRDLISIYQGVCADAVKRFDGHVAQYLGDGVLVYFGYPQAHEDDAQRAIRAALAIQASLASINQGRRAAGDPEIVARIGIHTGPVVVSTLGSDARSETLALGETVNIAARLDALAPPGGIAVSDATLRLAAGLFVTRDLGTPELKGISQPVQVHAVERALGVSARSERAHAATPLRGRERELGLLLDRWEQAQERQGHVIVLSGEPGIGKSRLLEEFRERIALAPHTALDLSCSPYAAGSAFQPAIELLERGLGFSESDEPAARLAKLEQGMTQLPGMEPAELVPYLAALLGLPPSASFPLTHMSADVQREKTLQALTAPILAMEFLQPVLVVAEDLHWSDPSTLELVGRLIDQTPTLRLMLVLTFRPTFVPPWPLARSYVSPLALSRLSPRATRELIEACAGKALPAHVLEDVIARADGVPLFAEELARAVVESGVVVESGGRYELRGRLSDLAIPTTLQGSLMARLDRLSAAKQVAQIGATLGREFSHALIEAVADVDVPALRNGLEQLVAAEILYRRGEPPDATYTFKHALLQDTAYESQLKSRRRELHARTAAVLGERFPARVAAEPQGMARHCAEGGLSERAIDYYVQAGQQALARLSNPEAAGYFASALELLATLAETPARHQREISLRLALAGPLSARGYDHPEVVANVSRIEALCEQLERGPARLPALVGLSVLHQGRGDLARSGRWARELLEVADSLGIAPLRVAGHAMLGAASSSRGTVVEAYGHFEAMRAIAATTQMPPPVAAFDLDVVVGLSAPHAMLLVLAGEPDQALARLEEGLSAARARAHAYTLSFVLSNGALMHHFREDYEQTRELADECLEVLRGRGFVQTESIALAFGGWARVMLGDASGEEQFERGLALLHSSGAIGGAVQYQVAATEIALRLGKLEQARACVERVALWVERTGDTMFAANTPMLRAEWIVASNGDLREAERLSLEALAGWRAYESPWMQLRSALLLGEIAVRTGDKAPARARLAGIVDGFHEGFETRRLREARRLLGQLAPDSAP